MTRVHVKQLLKVILFLMLLSLIMLFFYILQESGRYSIARGALARRFFTMIMSLRHSEECQFLNDDSSIQTEGLLKPDTDSVPSIVDLEHTLGPDLWPGGHYLPLTCRPKHKVALIIPFRDRQIHLKIFLRHIHPFLQGQKIEYRIIVVEQEAEGPFNRAMLMNIGFVESLKLHPFNCFVFHDVDLLPLNNKNMYACSDNPLHLSAAIDTHDFKLMYQNLFGGASALTKHMMEEVNGFSNVFFGWGGEDDDMSYRVRSHGMSIVRYSSGVARYTMMRHAKEAKLDRTRLLSSSRSRIHMDGLNSLKYKLLDIQFLPLYTWVYVGINQTEILEAQGLKG